MTAAAAAAPLAADDDAGAPLHRWSARRLQRALATRALRVEALAQALIERRDAVDAGLQAWVAFDADGARAAARRLDALDAPAGPLHGLPIGVKDIIDCAGWPSGCGSPIYAGHVADRDAACVALARAAGAWVLGKTVSTELANMTPGPTRNPHDAARTPGGSSSGSAAAVAAGLVPLALGTQTAGSVIRPAAYCGIVGYKPSPQHRIARAGVKPNSDTLDEVGVLARSVADAALLAAVLTGGDAGDAAPDAQRFVPRIGVTPTSRADAASAAMRGWLADAARRLAAAGAAVRDAAWPARFDALFEAQRQVQAFETARALAPEWQYRRALLSPALQALIDDGRGIDGAAYAGALAGARAARAALDDTLFDGVDVLLTFSATGAAPRGLGSTGDPLFCRPWQLLGCACVNVPGGRDADGLPLGLQVVGRPGDDARTLAAAAWIEARLGEAASG